MARLPRSLTVRSDHSVHKIWRGHNKEWNLASDSEKYTYLNILNDDFESDKYETGSEINALCLLSNHAHELYRIQKQHEFSEHMRRHHSKYGIYFNKLHKRCGKVAQDRPKTCLIADDDHEMNVVFYIHANPIRAGIVGDARDYHWSTHNLYAFGKRAPWMRNVKFPDWYLKLGRTPELRQRRYRQLFALFLKETSGRKQSAFQKLFYGPVMWVLKNENLVRTWRRSHAPPIE